MADLELVPATGDTLALGTVAKPISGLVTSGSVTDAAGNASTPLQLKGAVDHVSAVSNAHALSAINVAGATADTDPDDADLLAGYSDGATANRVWALSVLKTYFQSGMGSSASVNVETISSTKTVAESDPTYQLLTPSGGDQTVTLPATPAADTVFHIANYAAYDSYFALLVQVSGDSTNTFASVGPGAELTCVWDVADAKWKAYAPGCSIARTGVNTYATQSNTVVGRSALARSHSAAVGYIASGYSQSVAVGGNCTSNEYSVAVGNTATAKNSTVSIGYAAGALISSGTQCVFVGRGADFIDATQLDNAAAVGYNAKVSASNSVRLGNDSVISIECASTAFYTMGATATDGSWRLGRSGNDQVLQRRESGSWVTKFLISSAGTVAASYLNINGATADTDPDDTDEALIYSADASANRKVTLADLKTYFGGSSSSGVDMNTVWMYS